MSKSRRARSIKRKLAAVQAKIESIIAESNKHEQPKSSAQLEFERIQSERLRAIFTPEYMESWEASTAWMEAQSRKINSMAGRLKHRLEHDHRPLAGSCRTKRLRKKMHAREGDRSSLI